MKYGIEQLLGKTLSEIHNANTEILFVDNNGDRYRMWHSQDCCESVSIDDIVGDLNDLIGSEITMAKESVSTDNPKDEYAESFTWTFYKLATAKGYVDIRWYGSSNGYYSESVSFNKIDSDDEL